MTIAGSPVVESSLLSRPGAVAGSGPDAGVAWHYGDPVGEQLALQQGRAVVDQSQLGVVTVTGPDRLSWLNSLCSQEVAALLPGESTEFMILSPQGRIEHVAALVDDGETAWLITETAAGLSTFLDRMRFMLRVEVADVTADWAVLGEAVGRPAAAGEPVTWLDPWPEVSDGGTSYSVGQAGRLRAWRLVLVPRASLDAEVDARLESGWQLAGTWASEAERVAAYRPRAIAEVDELSLPHEYDWLRTAVHLHKGCYRGQETVAKVHNVGRPPRRLTYLVSRRLVARVAHCRCGTDRPRLGRTRRPHHFGGARSRRWAHRARACEAVRGPFGDAVGGVGRRTDLRNSGAHR